MFKRFRSVLLKIIIPLSLCLIVTGAAFLTVELKNKGSDPLVDLSEIISIGGSYLPGDFDSMDEADETVTDASETEETATDSEESETADASVSNAAKDEAEIEIYGETITYNGYSKDLSQILKYINHCYKNNTHMIFKVKYADYRIMSEIKAFIEENNITDYETDYDF